MSSLFCYGTENSCWRDILILITSNEKNSERIQFDKECEHPIWLRKNERSFCIADVHLQC